MHETTVSSILKVSSVYVTDLVDKISCNSDYAASKGCIKEGKVTLDSGEPSWLMPGSTVSVTDIRKTDLYKQLAVREELPKLKRLRQKESRK